MENIDKLVELITNRLLENLKSTPGQPSVLLLGSDTTAQSLEAIGYEVVTKLETATDYVVVEDLTLDAFLRVASLCPTTPEEVAVLNRLLEGKKVFVANEIFATDKYKKSARQPLYRELLKQKDKLESYGACFYETAQLTDLLANKAVTAVPEKTKTAQVKGKTQLITEAKLKALNLKEGDTFVAEKGMIITALAKDYLKRHKIILN